MLELKGILGINEHEGIRFDWECPLDGCSMHFYYSLIHMSHGLSAYTLHMKEIHDIYVKR